MTREEMIDKAIASLEKEIESVDVVMNMGEDEEFYKDYKKNLKKQIEDLKDDMINHILLCEENTREAEKGLTMHRIKFSSKFYNLRGTLKKLNLWPNNMMEILR